MPFKTWSALIFLTFVLAIFVITPLCYAIGDKKAETELLNREFTVFASVVNNTEKTQIGTIQANSVSGVWEFGYIGYVSGPIQLDNGFNLTSEQGGYILTKENVPNKVYLTVGTVKGWQIVYANPILP